MKKRRSWSLSRAAEQDLRDFRKFTIERWGPDQAKLYLSLIRSAIVQVRGLAWPHAVCPDELKGYFRVQVGSHIVYYRIEDGSIVVDRVLHKRMDVERHLWGEQ